MLTEKEIADLKQNAWTLSADVLTLIYEVERLRGYLRKIEDLRMTCSDMGLYTKEAEEISREALGV